MATLVDTWAIKQQIVDVLDSDSALYDSTGANEKVRKITVGAPRIPRLKQETTLPQIWVTNDSTIFTRKVRGKTESNVHLVNEYTYGFAVYLILAEGDGPRVEERLDDFVQLIDQTITENSDLRDPGGAESTRVVDECWVSNVQELGPAFQGLAMSGRVIRIKAIVTTA